MTTRRIVGPAARPAQAQRQGRRPSSSPLVPSASDAEQALIGALLIEGGETAQLVDECAQFVDVDSFLSPVWACAWRSLWSRAGCGDPVDPVIVAGDMERDVLWPDGAAYGPLTHLTMAIEHAPISRNAPHYARQVQQAAYRRRVINTAAQVSMDAYQHAGDPAELQRSIASQWQALDMLVAETETGELGPVFDQLEANAAAGIAAGASTGFACLDDWIGGCIPGHIWVLGGYSNVGKSMLACALANGLADNGTRVAIISLEMTAAQMAVRLLAGRVGASAAFRYQVRPGRPPATWTDAEAAAVASAKAAISPLIHVYQGVRTLEGVQSVARRGDYGVVIVDYGQLLEVQGVTSEYEMNTAAARGLQALAKQAPCTVVALSQVSQQHQRLGSEDSVFGFKASGAWAEVADLGLMLTRDKAAPEVLELAAVKNRHGLNAASGAKARLRIDKTTGALSEVVPLPPVGPAYASAYPVGEPSIPWMERREQALEAQEAW